MTELSENARLILRQRYLRRDAQGEVIETAEEMFARVARFVGGAERRYRKGWGAKRAAQAFLEAMSDLDFLPNSPTLMNAGTRLGQLAACFVLPVPDSIRGIFTAVSEMARIHQSGGGTGFVFSALRPEGDRVRSTGGVASGPVSFMRVFDQATQVVKQGGRRRGANMGVLRVDHPDIRSFVCAKEDPEAFTNFNLSVAVTDGFMKALRVDREFPLIHPGTGGEVRRERAGALFDLICRSAWHTGEPGLLFIDEVNRRNPTPALGDMSGTNPCGELPLYPYESCTLGSINLARMVRRGRVDYARLEEAVAVGVRFLDNVIDLNRYPLTKIRRMTLSNRKIGLGVMGFAEMLIQLGIPYDSEKAVRLATRLMRRFTEAARSASAALARERGRFPNFSRSVYATQGIAPLRNATVTTVAPTGTISLLAGTSSGIEPLFAVSFVRRILDGTRLTEINPFFREMVRRRALQGDDVQIALSGCASIQGMQGIPPEIQVLFKTAMDIPPEAHLRIQAAFQRHTDNAVSKTINLPREALPEDIRRIYLRAHALRCKGITVYRYGSRANQVLSVLDGRRRGGVPVEQEFDGSCRECGT